MNGMLTCYQNRSTNIIDAGSCLATSATSGDIAMFRFQVVGTSIHGAR